MASALVLVCVFFSFITDVLPSESLQIKATVGKGKFSTRDLPDLAHVYGRKNVKDAENAGQVALNWTAGAASEEETAGLDIIKMNKDAIRAGSESISPIFSYNPVPTCRIVSHL